MNLDYAWQEGYNAGYSKGYSDATNDLQMSMTHKLLEEAKEIKIGMELDDGEIVRQIQEKIKKKGS